MSRTTVLDLERRLNQAASYIKGLEHRLAHVEQMLTEAKPKAQHTQSARLQAVVARTAAKDLARRNAAN